MVAIRESEMPNLMWTYLKEERCLSEVGKKGISARDRGASERWSRAVEGQRRKGGWRKQTAPPPQDEIGGLRSKSGS